MIEAVLHIASENYYSCALTRKIPVRVYLIAINGSEGFGIIESLDGTESPLKRYAKSMRQSSNILEFEITYRAETQYWTRAVHQIDGASIHQTVLESGCMTRLPIIISDGWQMHSILAPSQTEFSKLFNNLRERFSTVELARLNRHPVGPSTPLLTHKQEVAFRAAYKMGYYEIPRRCEIQQLTKDMEIKRVAIQERLRRAERKIMKEFARQLGM
ncbi:hypothetical protein EU527_07665 [Candidatus Thorarchaeota archaeon]|nr:MAG: hypothetical protein EU527_07665 [Candidatus Thorarchaeota archaeon]